MAVLCLQNQFSVQANAAWWARLRTYIEQSGSGGGLVAFFNGRKAGAEQEALRIPFLLFLLVFCNFPAAGVSENAECQIKPMTLYLGGLASGAASIEVNFSIAVETEVSVFLGSGGNFSTFGLFSRPKTSIASEYFLWSCIRDSS